MANWQTWTAEQHSMWREWLAERPPEVRDLAKRFPPYKLFRMEDTGHRVFAMAYNEDGTLNVAVTAEFNFVIFPRNVFGVRPDSLTECGLPSKEAITGSLCTTEEQIESVIALCKGGEQ